MTKFNISKHGYETREVDKYIDELILKYEDRLAEQRKRIVDLKNDLTHTQKQIESYSSKDNQISQVLMVAVEKTEEMEKNANKAYELEMKRIDVLYSAWKDVVEELEDIKAVSNNEYLKEMLSIFHTNLEKSLSSKKDKEIVGKENYVKSVLEKMRNLITEKEDIEEVVFDEFSEDYKKIKEEDKKEKARLSNINNHINDFVKKASDGGKRSGELYDQGSAYEKNFLHNCVKDSSNGSAFDLNEALHPKEDLEEIMKAFDFAKSKKNGND